MKTGDTVRAKMDINGMHNGIQFSYTGDEIITATPDNLERLISLTMGGLCEEHQPFRTPEVEAGSGKPAEGAGVLPDSPKAGAGSRQRAPRANV